MKKKYKDVTIKEVVKTCKSNSACGECPLYWVCFRRYQFPNDISKEDLNTEVEL